MGLLNAFNGFFINWLSKEAPFSKFPLCDFDRICYEVRPCDVLLIEGNSRVSEVIKIITQSSWSHAALYLGKLHDIENLEKRKLAEKFFHGPADVQLLIEGVLGKGTVISPLSHYKQDHIRICRPSGLSPNDAQKVINYAIEQLGSDYDVRQILDLARFFFPWTIMPRRWRSRLFNRSPGNTTKTICSTMLARAFSAVDFPILPHVKENKKTGIELIQRNPRLFTPKDFDYSPYFEIIKYPFIAFDNKAMYRKLPWNRDGLISNDGEHISHHPEVTEIPWEKPSYKCEDNYLAKWDKPVATEIKKNSRK